MRLRAAIYVALMVPSIASSAPWEGVWLSDEASCALPKNERQGFRMTVSGTEGFNVEAESVCEFLKIEAISPDVTRIQTVCEAHGDTFEHDEFLLLDRDHLWIWYAPMGQFSPSYMAEYYRCPE